MEAMQWYPYSTSQTHVRAFLGIDNYYFQLMHNLASVTSHFRLEQEGRPREMCWTLAAEQAFQALKTALTFTLLPLHIRSGCLPKWSARGTFC